VRAHPGAEAVYVPNREDLVTYLRATLRPGDLCITLAAGDLTNIASELAGNGLR
jgi:UDP-N-acetylmuramate-alanine ligase